MEHFPGGWIPALFIYWVQCLERDGRSPSVLDVVPVLNYVTSDDIVFWFSVIIGGVEGGGGGNYGDPCQTIKTDMMEWGAGLTSVVTSRLLSPDWKVISANICVREAWSNMTTVCLLRGMIYWDRRQYFGNPTLDNTGHKEPRLLGIFH